MTSPATARSKTGGRKSAGALAAGKSAESRAFPVVAIGASAGGLEVFRSFLDAQTPKSGMALVMIQHLDPTHPSLMVELLSSHTSMSVVQAADGAALAACRAEAFRLISGEVLPARTFIGRLMVSRTGCDSV